MKICNRFVQTRWVIFYREKSRVVLRRMVFAYCVCRSLQSLLEGNVYIGIFLFGGYLHLSLGPFFIIKS